MAPKKAVDKKKAADDDAAEPAAPVEPNEETLFKLFDACRDSPELGVPCLIGVTQGGKTHLISRRYAASRGFGGFWRPSTDEVADHNGVRVFNPQNDLPEDIGGLPEIEKFYEVALRAFLAAVHEAPKSGFTSWLVKTAATIVKSWTMPRVRYTLPYVIPPEMLKATPEAPWLLFGDEIDKTRRDVISTLLTLCNPDERRMRDTWLPRSVFLVCAMNEPQSPLPDAFLARMLFIKYPLHLNDCLNRFKPMTRSIMATLFDSGLPPTRLPKRPVTWGAGHKLERWIDRDDFWEDPALRQLVVYGLFPEEKAQAVLAMLLDRPVVPGVEWAKAVRLQDIKKNIAVIMTALDQETRRQVLDVFAERSNADATEEFANRIQEIFSDPATMQKIQPSPSHIAAMQAQKAAQA